MAHFEHLQARVARPAPNRTIARPVLFRIASVGIAVCGFSFFVVALFGFVTFINAWNRWQRYEGHPFHRAEFEVMQAYFQKSSRHISIYARGTVEGQQQWMDLERYVGTGVRSQEEVDEQVAAGTWIPVYFFPDLKGRARVQLASDPPPAEASKQQAVNAASHALTGLAITAVLMLVLLRVRRLCYAPAPGLIANP
jgi:hypothetical protein